MQYSLYYLILIFSNSIPLQYLERDVQQAGKNFYCDDKLHNDDIQKNDKKKEFFAYFNKGL